MVPGAGSVPAIQRIPLPGAEMLEEEPLYVNAKQYHRILKRRQARAKLEAEGKIPKERRVRMQLGSNPGLQKNTRAGKGGLESESVLSFLLLFTSYIAVFWWQSRFLRVLFIVVCVCSCIANGHLL